MPKSTQTREDIKVKVNIQSLIHLYIFLQQGKDVRTGLCIFTFTFIYILPCLCIFWHAIPTSLNDFLFFLRRWGGGGNILVRGQFVDC